MSYRAVKMTAPKLKARSEDWFLAAGAGRDAAQLGKPISANPFTANRPDWRAWNQGWTCQHKSGEDVTRRFRISEGRCKARGAIDYTTDAIHDFARYAFSPDLPDEDRQWAQAMVREVKREAEIRERVTAKLPKPEPLRTTEQLETLVAQAVERWPDASFTEIALRTNILDKRLKQLDSWKRHRAAKEATR